MDLVRRHQKTVRSIALALFSVISAWLVKPGVAHAYHTDSERVTDYSAFTLRRNEWRLGLFQHEYGIFDWWTVGTYTVPWVMIPVTQSFNGSLYTKLRVPVTPHDSLSVNLRAFYLQWKDLNMGTIENGDFSALIMPMSLSYSHIFNDVFTLTGDVTWVQTFLKANVDTVDETQFLGAGAQSNLQFSLNAEFRTSRVVAFHLVTRWVPYVVPGKVSTSTTLDGTSADIDIQFDPSELRNAWLVQPGVTFSWKYFNWQLGLGYGNLFVPGVRLVAATKTIVPDLDFYFRF